MLVIDSQVLFHDASGTCYSQRGQLIRFTQGESRLCRTRYHSDLERYHHWIDAQFPVLSDRIRAGEDVVLSSTEMKRASLTDYNLEDGLSAGKSKVCSNLNADIGDLPFVKKEAFDMLKEMHAMNIRDLREKGTPSVMIFDGSINFYIAGRNEYFSLNPPSGPATYFDVEDFSYVSKHMSELLKRIDCKQVAFMKYHSPQPFHAYVENLSGFTEIFSYEQPEQSTLLMRPVSREYNRPRLRFNLPKDKL